MTEPADDPAVADDEALLRRIPDLGSDDFFPVDRATGERRLSSGAFEPDDDGVSVYRSVILAHHSLGPADLVRDPLHAVAEVSAGRVRAVQLGVAADPQPPSPTDSHHAVGAAHALIVGFGELSKSQRKRRQRDLARAAVLCVPRTLPSGPWRPRCLPEPGGGSGVSGDEGKSRPSEG